MVVIYSQGRKKASDPLLEDDFLELIKHDYPALKFVAGAKYAFRPPRTVVVGPDEADAKMLLLHEVGHALCKHKTFNTGVERVKMEAEAWEKAKELALKYGVTFDENKIEAELDTYRDWLHKKSRCPKCGLTRFETPDGVYHCPRCENFI